MDYVTVPRELECGLALCGHELLVGRIAVEVLDEMTMSD
jgi:hypothetical protein